MEKVKKLALKIENNIIHGKYYQQELLDLLQELLGKKDGFPIITSDFQGKFHLIYKDTRFKVRYNDKYKTTKNLTIDEIKSEFGTDTRFRPCNIDCRRVCNAGAIAPIMDLVKSPQFASYFFDKDPHYRNLDAWLEVF